ncbi:unnamed protein product [Haemonchus placei]|uniref:Reverse transcriptase domain-containing protein n=1 Tax=Haemonchus placei TaxID=6290 RepID=A0A0N4X0S5_HAEPC|nr:unnamed protein product [Haemonchus placei]
MVSVPASGQVDRPADGETSHNKYDSKSIRDKARTSPGKSGAQGPRLSSVDSTRGLPRSERPRPKKLFRIGTLNETRWKGAGQKNWRGCQIFYNGEDTKRNGVAVAVAHSLKDSVSAVNRVSSRIISVRIDTKEGNWTIISVYAPQTGCPIYEKDEFYLSLDETIRSVPEGDYLTIAGDLNGHVGSERRGLERVHGGKGVGVRNDEGERVLALAIAHDLAVCSTFFGKRKSQKVTYSSGGKETEIDHVLVRRSSLKTVKDIKALPGEDLAPQHRPLLANIAIDPPKKSRTRTERRIRWWKLHQSEREHLKEKILKAGLPNPEGPIQQTWSNAVEVILRCAKETLGETREHLISLVKDMYDGSTTTIRTPHSQTGAIDVTVGVHQRSALSPFLFLLTMDVITEELMGGPLKTILYADDIALIAESKDELQDKLQNWQRVLEESGLRLNMNKTKFLSSEEGTESIVYGRGKAIEKVQDFRYLGSDPAADGSVDQAVKKWRINAAWTKWRESTGILCDRRCSRTLKGKVYRTVVRPTILYGSEC